ncbi:MAG: hypothetical protein V3R80_07940, partial [Candidatus Tectomicrobia bacterium]
MLQQLPGASRKPLARASPIAFCTLLQQWSRAAGPAAGSRRWAARWRGFGFPRHVFGQAAIAAGIIVTGGRSPGSRLRKPATATPAAQPQWAAAALGSRRLRVRTKHRGRRRRAKRAMTFPQRMLYGEGLQDEAVP